MNTLMATEFTNINGLVRPWLVRFKVDEDRLTLSANPFWVKLTPDYYLMIRGWLSANGISQCFISLHTVHFVHENDAILCYLAFAK